MKIKDIQSSIEEGLANLPGASLPHELAGLRFFPCDERDPQVSLRYRDGGRKVRQDTDSSYFNPDTCEIVIRFVPIETAAQAAQYDMPDEQLPSQPAESPGDFDWEPAADDLVDQLKSAEQQRHFVGLKWFRDQFLPHCGLQWAGDIRKSGAVLRRATEDRLVLTSQVPNPDNPLYPVTAIRVNRGHPRLQVPPVSPEFAAGFEPITIRGGSLSATVIEARR